MARSSCASMGSRPFPHGEGDQCDPASHIVVDGYAEGPGADRVHDIVRDPGRQALAERSLIAIRPEIVLERLRLEAALTGGVLDGHAAEVRLAGAGTDGCEFRGRQGHGPHVRSGKGFGLEVLPSFRRARGPGERSCAGQPGRLRGHWSAPQLVTVPVCSGGYLSVTREPPATKPKAIALLSGGIDSTTALALAQRQGVEVHALAFRYGQRHEVEIAAARRVARALHVARHEIVEFDLRRFGGSALTDGIAVPKDRTPAELAAGIPVTYVPARNTIFLSFAVAWAEVVGAADVFIGVTALDYSGYPDCRPEYIAAFQTMAGLATRAGVEGRQRLQIHTPLIALSKREIILTGLSLGVDYALTSSCYDPAPGGDACGPCWAPGRRRLRLVPAAASCVRAASACCNSTSRSPQPCTRPGSKSRSRRTARCCRHPGSIGCASAPRLEPSSCSGAGTS